MQVQEYEKFAFVLRSALEKNQVKLSKKIKYEFEPLWAIRAVERKDSDCNIVSEKDFYSQEEKKYYRMKLPRGVKYEFSHEPGNYSCSFFKSKDELANALHLPKIGWKLATGNLIKTYGAIQHRETKPHIHLFRYDNAVPEFQIIEFDEL